MEQKGMSVRVRALLAAVLFLATSCTTDSADGVPPPVARTPDEAIVSVAGPVPADRWRAALIAGDNNSPAFDNTVEAVPPAAASARASFGCGAGDQYTYYDQCLLQQFDGAATWRELAAATRSCVESLERRMGVKPPSQPQIFVGAAVTDLRIPGR